MQTSNKETLGFGSLKAIKTRIGPVDFGMLERTGHALELLGRLVDAKADLVCKGGGTSLVLRLQTIRRLSIDVDITFSVSLALCRHGLAKNREEDVEPCRLLEDGIGRMTNYLINSRFGRDEAKIAASRAALLCHLLKTDQCNGPLDGKRFNRGNQDALAKLEIKWPQAALNKLLATTPEAFFYWAEIFKDLPGRPPSVKTPAK